MLSAEHWRAHDCPHYHLPKVPARICLEDPVWEPAQVSDGLQQCTQPLIWFNFDLLFVFYFCHDWLLILAVDGAIYALVMANAR